MGLFKPSARQRLDSHELAPEVASRIASLPREDIGSYVDSHLYLIGRLVQEDARRGDIEALDSALAHIDVLYGLVSEIRSRYAPAE